MGFYGNRGETLLTEASDQGRGFLPDLCAHWERASDVLKANGTRILHARLGSVIAQDGGIVATLRPLFRMGLGAVLGKGDQWLSWIGKADAIAAFYHLLVTEQLEGPVNLTSPHSVRNREFAQALAHACNRILWMRIPAPLLRCVLGEKADELLLASTHVLPQKLMETSFTFRNPDLASALSIS